MSVPALPNIFVSFRLVIAEVMETSISGITIIVNRRTYPEPITSNQMLDCFITADCGP